jgi:hypothetical protein
MNRSVRVGHLRLAPRTIAAAAAALLSSALGAAPAMAVGYPAPGGIYAPFVDCPLHDPEMRLAAPGFAMGCIQSITASGSLTVGFVPVPITQPVTVQFGTYSDLDSNGNQVFHVVPPQDHKELLTEPQVIPNGFVLLVCLSGNPDVARLCQTAMTNGHTDLSVDVQSAGPITNFSPLALTPFTLPVKVQLVNPMLGGNCYIGSDDDPVVLNPTFNPPGAISFESDPNPAQFPNVAVLSITGSTLTDDTFSVPAATGCGPGDVADAAINTMLSLPSASGSNHLVLNDNDALFADDFSDSDQARDLLAAFMASR